MFFLHLDCCGSELELQMFPGRSGPGTLGPLVSGVVLPGQQVTPPPRFLHVVVLADPAAADGSVLSFGATFTGLLGERGSSVWAPAARMERQRSCWAIYLLPNLPPFLC